LRGTTSSKSSSTTRKTDRIPFNWSRLPANVKHVLLYSFVLRQVQPWGAICRSNPANPLPDPEGFEAFIEKLCPAPYRV